MQEYDNTERRAFYTNLLLYRRGGGMSVETMPGRDALAQVQESRAVPGVVGAAAVEMLAYDNRSMPRINRTLAKWGRARI